MRYIVLLLLLTSCFDTSLKYGKEKVINLNNAIVIPFNNNYLTVDAKVGETVLYSYSDKEFCYKKEYLTIYKKDTSHGSSGGYCYHLTNDNNNVFITIHVYGNKCEDTLKEGDKVYTIWTPRGIENKKIIQ